MENDLLSYLRSPDTIREICMQIYQLAQDDRLRHFKLHEDRISNAAYVVAKLIEDKYPSFDIPFHSRWRHFEGPSPAPITLFEQATSNLNPQDRARTAFDLVIVSVLLDAGAGKTWKYLWKTDGKSYSRSEGLAISSYQMFVDGIFSSDPSQPMRVDAKRLANISRQDLAAGLQVEIQNPLDGLNGRVELMHRLGNTLLAQPQIFTRDGVTRLGHLYDHLIAAADGGKLPAPTVLAKVLSIFENIWPGRISRAEHNLGDVWEHPQVRGRLPGSERLVPFHKLSQWLTYSLLEPLSQAGIEITGIDGLTGLAEYRNGGFFIDAEVITPRDPEILVRTHEPGSQIIVEWRALTVCLLDKLAIALRERWNMDATSLPMVKVLEGGTWKAGRLVAAQKRADGAPPLNIISDGTVF
jgi:Protein of unknown function (DUF1688)